MHFLEIQDGADPATKSKTVNSICRLLHETYSNREYYDEIIEKPPDSSVNQFPTTMNFELKDFSTLLDDTYEL